MIQLERDHASVCAMDLTKKIFTSPKWPVQQFDTKTKPNQWSYCLVQQQSINLSQVYIHLNLPVTATLILENVKREGPLFTIVGSLKQWNTFVFPAQWLEPMEEQALPCVVLWFVCSTVSLLRPLRAMSTWGWRARSYSLVTRKQDTNRDTGSNKDVGYSLVKMH